MRVTAAGSLPGDDFRGALAAITEILPEVLPLPELPARGVGSGMTGRALGIIDGLGFDIQPAGWRLTAAPGADHRRARARWRHDLDDAEELLQGFDGVLKIGLAGPWTLAATVERPRGDRLLADHGARRELAQALTEGWFQLREDLKRRIPGVKVLLQLDEPALTAVGDGGIPTASGFSRHRRVGAPELAGALKPLADGAWLHCCAPGKWLPVAERAGFAAAAVDTRLFREPAEIDALAQWAQAGRGLALGVVDTASGRVQGVDELVRETLRVLRPLELPVPSVDSGVLLTTACGMVSWKLADVPGQLAALCRAATLVAEDLQ